MPCKQIHCPAVAFKNAADMVRNVPNIKVFALRRMFIAGKVNKSAASRELGIDRRTIFRYFREFSEIRKHYPEKLSDMHFYMPGGDRSHRLTRLYHPTIRLLPEVIAAEKRPRLSAVSAYQHYKQLMPEGYSYSAFKDVLFKYCRENNISLICNKIIPFISVEDKAVLARWRKGNDHQRWQVAVVLEAAHTRISLLYTVNRVECCFRTALRWIDIYQRSGLAGFERSYTVNPEVKSRMKEKMDNVLHLVQQSPKIYGLPKTSWTTKELAGVYEQVYGSPMSAAAASVYLRKQGINTRRAKEVLTSPDPLFREKFAAIQDILAHLGPSERFFSIDEYGPASVRPKGGRALALPGGRPVFEQVQKGKGWFIMFAALELSTNQVSHFYTRKKDTAEMIRLIDLLVGQYRDCEKLYLSWDAVSFHASRKLLAHIAELNSPAYRARWRTPAIGVAPLPSSAQFLNVIESVFSGMARSVIHNSDYQSLEECCRAIDAHFEKRNRFFKDHPQKAGKMIWGKEKVPAVFDKSNLCRSRSGNHKSRS
ncbi:IS630 family transposase [Mucilaginibacter conchicola]|uniref:IS630 family transposase n=1 Tax=Mucilaginibacter conchicola TaxID=2303333 RepID=A0A372NW55_9SPHI|nr:IS630 family transposase [Mucilaginibacter conchicola]RFZ92857.1 IS630 family transposase [Mucilaginibacter conchicola]